MPGRKRRAPAVFHSSTTGGNAIRHPFAMRRPLIVAALLASLAAAGAVAQVPKAAANS